jgi:hypothetical protein
VRSIKDIGALDRGFSSELPAILGSHPIEDVMHLGSWIQLFTILHSGIQPTTFQAFPNYNGRPPELVCGRTYPLLGVNPEIQGTICLCPDNRSDAALITIRSDPEADVWNIIPLFDVQLWHERIKEMDLMVAPLVFRHYAVFRDASHSGSAPYVAVDFGTHQTPPYDVSRYPVDISNTNPVQPQFLDSHACYTLMKSPAERLTVPFMEAHENLLPIGTFILVENDSIHQFGLGCSKHWIRGSLRYPDEVLAEDNSDDSQLRIYVTVRIRTRPGEEDEVRVVYAPPTSCRIFSEMRVTEADYSIDVTRQVIRVHGSRGVAVV